jgi:hypothetical protein
MNSAAIVDAASWIIGAGETVRFVTQAIRNNKTQTISIIYAKHTCGAADTRRHVSSTGRVRFSLFASTDVPGIDEPMQALTGRGCACHSSKRRLN